MTLVVYKRGRFITLYRRLQYLLADLDVLAAILRLATTCWCPFCDQKISTSLWSYAPSVDSVYFFSKMHSTGLPFITGNSSLPKNTFCAYDLTQWLCKSLIDVISIEGAVQYAQVSGLFENPFCWQQSPANWIKLLTLQSLLDADLICHSSGMKEHNFIHGFFFYTLLVEFSPALTTPETTG